VIMDFRSCLYGLSDVIINRPTPLRVFDQIYMKLPDMLLQAELTAQWCDGKTVGLNRSAVESRGVGSLTRRRPVLSRCPLPPCCGGCMIGGAQSHPDPVRPPRVAWELTRPAPVVEARPALRLHPRTGPWRTPHTRCPWNPWSVSRFPRSATGGGVESPA
jgi:hypothetical protein